MTSKMCHEKKRRKEGKLTCFADRGGKDLGIGKNSEKGRKIQRSWEKRESLSNRRKRRLMETSGGALEVRVYLISKSGLFYSFTNSVFVESLLHPVLPGCWGYRDD